MLRRRLRTLALVLLPLLLASAAQAALVFAGFSVQLARAKTVESVVAETVARRAARLGSVPDEGLPDRQVVRVLLLGLDARAADQEPHCDAIHLVSVDTGEWTVGITSVPRGTYAYIPKEKLDWTRLDKEQVGKQVDAQRAVPAKTGDGTPEPSPAPVPIPPLTQKERDALVEQAFVAQESYLANACAYLGLEEGVRRIERVLGTEADYVVTVGFSQTVGILRLLGLPGSEALQWLRHRQGYALGDPQRSHNQAVFLKDLAHAHAPRLADPLMLPFARILFSSVRTDMGFGTAYALLRGLADSGLGAHPERVTLSMRPSYQVADYHFDPEAPLKGLEGFYATVARHLGKKDFSGATAGQVQEALVASVDAALASGKPMDGLFDKEIWLQVEDAATRERLHFALVERQARALALSGDLEGAIGLVTDFVIEKETLGLGSPEHEGRALLARLIAPETE